MARVPPPAASEAGGRPLRTYYGDKYSESEVTPWGGKRATRGGKRKEDVAETDRQTDTMRHDEEARSPARPLPSPAPGDPLRFVGDGFPLGDG